MIKLTRERTLLAGVMLAAVAGLTYDRLTASAAELDADSSQQVAQEPSAPPVPTSVVRSDEANLAARLATLAKAPTGGSAERHNPFATLHQVRTADEQTTVALSPRWQQRTLSGVVIKPNGRHIAIVDGKAIVLGAEFDGLRLINVTKDTAVFSNGSTQFALRSRK